MKNNEEKHNQLLSYLSHLPKKIVALEGSSHTPEFILHELCNENCFNLSKAAFFVDNPDFDYLKGVAGFSMPEAYGGANGIWQEPQEFSEHMSKADFNQRVKSLSLQSLKRTEVLSNETVAQIAKELGFENPAYRFWQMKHDNHGFLVYEYNGSVLPGIEEHLDNSLYLLSFCPIF
jgi:hypothetical protein